MTRTDGSKPASQAPDPQQAARSAAPVAAKTAEFPLLDDKRAPGSPVASTFEQIAWHTLTPEETLARLGVEAEYGLTTEESRRRLAQVGPNELKSGEQISPLKILLRQFVEPLVLVLVAAAIVSFIIWLFEKSEPWPYDSIVILAIVLLNGLLGFVQEYRAEQSVAALKEMAAPESVVRRDGDARHVPARELVPGDILLLEAGVRIPADARLVHAFNLNVEESALTGESTPVHKFVQPLHQPDISIGDRDNMVFMGTAVTYGRGEAVVVATGMNTEMGRIATLLQEVKREDTPLQRELARVGTQLGILVLAISIVVSITGLMEAGQLTGEIVLGIFLFGVALAVAAIPEGLPAIVTAVLALGVRRMADRNAIVRRLSAVETLGSATVICSDKTGTLTRNEMTVREVLLGIDRVVHVDGEGYDPTGTISLADGSSIDASDPAFFHLLRAAALNNDARLSQSSQGRWQVVGDPTEGALLVLARKAGVDVDGLRREVYRQGEIPFSSERKRMTTVHQLSSQAVAYVKGAPEVLIQLCSHMRMGDQVVPLSDPLRERIVQLNEKFAIRAMRTLAFASRIVPPNAQDERGDYRPDLVETDLIWEGLVGMIDPPRAEAKEAVQVAKQAGIRTIMITGDHKLTALAIARELGIADADSSVATGQELSVMDDEALRELVQRVSVYARVDPEHKLDIVKALKAHGEVVAMTGDGVNDAPALKQADIGVAMGITGTDVSKEASDMILADDNFATIVAAVEAGRNIFENIRKFIRYLLSSNAGEVLTMFVAILISGILALESDTGAFFLPLLAVQILWINLVTDGGPALALGIDPPEPDLMQRPPRRANEPVIGRVMWLTIALVGIVMTAGTLFVLDAYMPGGLVSLPVVSDSVAGSVGYARTMAFTTLVLYQMFNVFNCRSQDHSILKIGLFTNRWLVLAVASSIVFHMLVIYWSPLQTAFEAAPLTLFDWGLATAVASSVMIVMEIVKLTPWLKE
jgi:Ca2+-transporting ATPase